MADITVFYTTLSSIPKGHFTTYGTLAALCGVHVRQIQAWLRRLPEGSQLPWYRIINHQHRITEHPGASLQYQLLANEGLLPDAKGRFNRTFFWPNTNPKK